MQGVPGVTTFKLPARRFASRTSPRLERGSSITLKSTLVTTTAKDGSLSSLGVARTTLIPPGFCVVKKTSDGLYYAADDATDGDRNGAAAVTSDEAADADWASKVITTVVNGKSIAVTLGAGDDTTAEVVTALNADATFAAMATASGTNGNPVVITTREKGADVHLKVSINTIDTAFGTNAIGKWAAGTDADYRVLGYEGAPEDWADMLDSAGAVKDTPAVNVVSGIFTDSKLLRATGEARVVLARRGSIFV